MKKKELVFWKCIALPGNKYIFLRDWKVFFYFLPEMQNPIFIAENMKKERGLIMEEKKNGIYFMLAEMLESQEMSKEEEGKIRELFEGRENRRAEVRIAYDLLDLLQKEVRHKNNFNPNSLDISGGFAAALYQARMRNGITQQQLAELTGINQADISRFERGFSNPSLATAKRLADGLGMGLNIEFV